MTNPITPPPELVQQWYQEADSQLRPYYVYIAIRAAQWGADQELEACCDLLLQEGAWPWPEEVARLRAARRPKPPRLKEQALAALQEAAYMADDSPPQGICSDQIDTNRRALEALDD